MTKRAIIRLAQIAADLDRAGRPHDADLVEDAMLRLSQSAIQNWWDGVKDVGKGIAQDAKAAGEIVTAPFEAAGAAVDSAWNQGIKNVPAAWGQAADQSYSRVRDDTAQELHDYSQAAPELAGPGGTGLAGAAVQDAVSGVGNAASSAAQGYVNNAVSAEEQAKQQQNMAAWLQQALQRHRADGHGWEVINNAIQYGQMSPDNQARLRQQFQAATYGAR